MGRIFPDIMSVNYGIRRVEFTQKLGGENQPAPLGMDLGDAKVVVDFDFSILKKIQFGVRQDVGASSYWSEIANMQTLDNLLMNHHINAVQYLERMPNGYIAKKEALIAELKGKGMGAFTGTGSGTGMSMATTSEQTPQPQSSGNSALQRAITKEGA
jgi:hypothetical protein